VRDATFTEVNATLADLRAQWDAFGQHLTIEKRILELLAHKTRLFDDDADPSSVRDASRMARDGSIGDITTELQTYIDQERLQG